MFMAEWYSIMCMFVSHFTFSKTALFIYLRFREKAREMNRQKREFPSAGLLPKRLQWLGLGQDRSWQLGAQSNSPPWETETKLFEPSPLSPRVFFGEKLESGTRARIEPQHDVGCRLLNHLGQTFSLLPFFNNPLIHQQTHKFIPYLGFS